MKKIIILLLVLFVCGCDLVNTPTSKVESFLGKYQRLDRDVLNDLDGIINEDKSMNSKEKKEYKELLEKQYQNLSYKIKNEETDNNISIVDVEIEVLNYKSSIRKSMEYYNSKKEEFGKEKDISKNHKFIEYELKELRQVNDKVKYELSFRLEKDKGGNWIINELSKSDREKIHGLY